MDTQIIVTAIVAPISLGLVIAWSQARIKLATNPTETNRLLRSTAFLIGFWLLHAWFVWVLIEQFIVSHNSPLTKSDLAAIIISFFELFHFHMARQASKITSLMGELVGVQKSTIDAIKSLTEEQSN